MNGGIPKEEVNKYNYYFDVFPSLRSDLFGNINASYYELKVNNLHDFIMNHQNLFLAQ